MKGNLPVEFMFGDVLNHGFNNDEFDSVRAERVLMHIADNPLY